MNGQTRGLGIYLAAPCLEQLCEPKKDSDAPSSCIAEADGAACEPVREVTTQPVAVGD